MKRKKLFLFVSVPCLILFTFLSITGIGYQGSGAAARSFREQLTALHGEPYTGRQVEDGVERMEFAVKPDNFFFSKHSFRWYFSLDYEYTCSVIYTCTNGDDVISIRRVIYDGYDPIGYEKDYEPAYLDISSQREYLTDFS